MSLAELVPNLRDESCFMSLVELVQNVRVESCLRDER